MNPTEHPIFLESIKYIRSKINISGLSQVQQSIVERIIHSSGDFSLKACIRFSPNACENGIDALQKGSKILTDTFMAEAAISSMAKRTINANIQCILSKAPKIIDSNMTTRSAIGMRNYWLDLFEKGHLSNPPLVVIGSSPTALMSLLDLIDSGYTKPSLIIGMPVGFIGVSESKIRLLNSQCPHIVLEGSRGGASLAAAATNALLKAAENAVLK